MGRTKGEDREREGGREGARERRKKGAKLRKDHERGERGREGGRKKHNSLHVENLPFRVSSTLLVTVA